MTTTTTIPSTTAIPNTPEYKAWAWMLHQIATKACTPVEWAYTRVPCITREGLYGGSTNHSSSTLPFTGFNLMLIVLAALFLFVLGASLRRIGRDA